MRKNNFILLLNILLFSTAQSFAQTPQYFNYQAVLRNNSGSVIVSQPVNLKVSIHDNTAGGTVVFQETHSETTNQFGIVNLKIGNGTQIVGPLSSVPWATGDKFVEVEIDYPIGSGYTSMGTQQLLTVPYALHSKTADTITGVITEVDPVFTAWDKDYTDLINKPTIPIAADGSETKISAGTNVIVAGTGTIANPYIISAPDSSIHAIGESYGGGIVFYVTHNGQHGLIAETQDQSESCKLTDAQDSISYSSNHSIAGANFTDWRLPTKNELNLLFAQKTIVGGFTTLGYWSSTPGDPSNGAWVQYFGDGWQNYVYEGSNNYVRSIRAF